METAEAFLRHCGRMYLAIVNDPLAPPEHLREADQQLHTLVKQARAYGLTYAQISEYTGISLRKVMSS